MLRTKLRTRRFVALLAGVGAALALSTPSAHALAPEDVPAIGADTGRFNLPINCAISLPDFGGIKVLDLGTTVDVQGVAATQFGPGQQFYLTQGSGKMTFPKELTQLGGLVGLTHADATIPELSIGAENAQPPSRNVAEQPQKVEDIPLRPGEPLTVGLPAKGTFEVGPYTAPDSGVVTLQFRKAVAFVDLNTDTGTLLRVRADCTPTEGNALLSIAVGGPEGQPPARIHGAPLNFPPVPPGTLTGIINAPYRCTLGGDELPVGIAVGGNLPLAVERGGSLQFTEASGALVVPKETVNRLLDTGIRTISGEVTKLDLVISGGTPAVQNVARDGIAVPETPLNRDQQIVLPLPTHGTLTAGPFTPTADAASVKIALGGAAADFRVNGSASMKASCAAPSPEVILADAPIT